MLIGGFDRSGSVPPRLPITHVLFDLPISIPAIEGIRMDGFDYCLDVRLGFRTRAHSIKRTIGTE